MKNNLFANAPLKFLFECIVIVSDAPISHGNILRYINLMHQLRFLSFQHHQQYLLSWRECAYDDLSLRVRASQYQIDRRVVYGIRATTGLSTSRRPF